MFIFIKFHKFTHHIFIFSLIDFTVIVTVCVSHWTYVSYILVEIKSSLTFNIAFLF